MQSKLLVGFIIFSGLITAVLAVLVFIPKGGSTDQNNQLADLHKPEFLNDTPKTTCDGALAIVELSWSADPIGAVSLYVLERRNITARQDQFSVVHSASTTSFTDTVSTSNTYDYRIKAVGHNSARTSISDISPKVTSDACETSAPLRAFLSLNSVSSGGGAASVSLKWSNSGKATSFRVFRSQTGGRGFVEVAFLEGSSLVCSTCYSYLDSVIFYSDRNVNDGTSYSYRVYAYNKFALYDASNPLKAYNISANLQGGITSNDLSVFVPLGLPGQFTAKGEWVNDEGTIFKITWTAAASSVKGGSVTYRVEKSDSESFLFPIVVCAGVRTPSILACQDSVNPQSPQKFYRVVASNKGGVSSSNVINLPAKPYKNPIYGP